MQNLFDIEYSGKQINKKNSINNKRRLKKQNKIVLVF